MRIRETKNEIVRTGIIGLGDHSDRSHLMYLANMPDLCKVTALGDLDEKRIQATKEKYELSAKGFTDWRQLVSSPDVDAVLVMTPDRFHTMQLVDAIASGKHVFCEKPLASTEKEYYEIVEAFALAEQKNITVSTCHPRRFDPPFIVMKSYIESTDTLVGDFGTMGKLGKVTAFVFNFNYHKPSKHGLHMSLMFDHLNHEVDIMHYLFGVSGIDQATKHHDNETAFFVTGAREDGIQFSFTGARHREESIYPEDMEIVFENGSLKMDMHKGTASLSINGQSFLREDSRYKTDYTTRFERINRHFLKSVLGLEKQYITTKEMLINTRAAIDLQAQKS